MSTRRLSHLAVGGAVLAAVAGAVASWAWPASGAPGALTVERGLVYDVADGAPLHLDVYLPAHDRPVPAVVLVHGGGWVSGGRANYGVVAPAMARAGLVAVSVDYTLARGDRATFPLAAEEVLDAVAYVRHHAGAWGVDPGAIGMMGDSAGAHLALLAAVDPTLVRPAEPVEAVVGWSGPYDLVSWRPDVGVLSGTAAMLRNDMAAFVGCGGGVDSTPCVAEEMAASPDRVARPGVPPALLVTSERYGPFCEIVDPIQTDLMANALRSVGGSVDVVHTGVCGHALGYTRSQLAGTLAFLTHTLG
ncbi:MAG TPA: alpha/beta hydrolase [Acidimicrobiales bacterium]|nr:alpha/beta hydrolase [Acidimicrobiales bacterium]